MAKGLITKTTVDDCQPGTRQFVFWDAGDGATKGFGLLVLPSGTKSYIYQYRIGGRSGRLRRYTIGKHGSWTPDKARKEAEKLKAQVRLGIDPINALRDKIAADEKARVQAKEKAKLDRELAFTTYAHVFLRLGLKATTRKRTREGYASTLANHISPVLGSKPLPDIKRTDIVRVMDRIPVSKPAVRRITFAVMRMLFNWALGRGDISASPLDGMIAPPLVASRDRVLTDNELALALRAAAQIEAPFGPLYEMLFATGQRREEVAGIKWSELDRDDALWILPKERAKTGEANIVPLNRRAIAALDRAAASETVASALLELERSAAKDGRKVQPAERTSAAQHAESTALAELASGTRKWPKRGLVLTTTGKTPVSGYSRAKKRLDALMEQIAKQEAVQAGQPAESVTLEQWRLHDARRTLATGLQRLGVRFEVTEAVLNHTAGASRSGVAAVYQRHGWKDEKRAALAAWADHCDKILNPSTDRNNIIALRPNTYSSG